MKDVPETLAALLTTKDVADRLGLTVSKVHHLIDKGEIIPDFQLPGMNGRFYFTDETIDEYLKAS